MHKKPENSCLVQKLKHYYPLTERDVELLIRLEENSEDHPRKTILLKPDETCDDLFVLSSGVVAGYCELADGGRLIMNIYFPGDLVNLLNVGFKASSSGLLVLADATICPFPKQGLGTIFRESPRLSALIYAVGMQENVVLLDRLRAIGRMPGKMRVILLLLQILTRRRLLNHDIGASFELPLTQEQMGDAVGLTSVYISNIFRELQQEGLVERDRRKIRILDEARMKESCHFEDRLYDLETAWFPK